MTDSRSQTKEGRSSKTWCIAQKEKKSLLTKWRDGKKEGDVFEVVSTNCIARHNIVFPV